MILKERGQSQGIKEGHLASMENIGSFVFDRIWILKACDLTDQKNNLPPSSRKCQRKRSCFGFLLGTHVE